MKIIQINTTAFNQDDFLLLTDLTHEQIIEVIEPIILLERSGVRDYSNDDLVEALEMAYPDNLINMYIFDHLDLISI
jgi:uncharacterized iron-regulated membrane protein